MKYRLSAWASSTLSSRPTSIDLVFAAGAQDLDGVASLLRDADLAGEAVAGPARQDTHHHLAALVARGVDDRVRDLVLGAVAAVARHHVHAAGDGGQRLLAGVAVLVGDADLPVHAVLAEDVVEDAEDGLIVAGRRVDDHVYALVRHVSHRDPPRRVRHCLTTGAAPDTISRGRCWEGYRASCSVRAMISSCSSRERSQK